MKVTHAALVSVLALQLSACGGAGGGLNTVPAPVPTPTPTPTPPLTGAISANLQNALQNGALRTINCGTASCGEISKGISYNSAGNYYNIVNFLPLRADEISQGPVSGFKYFDHLDSLGGHHIILTYDNSTAAQALTYTSYAVDISPASASPDISAHVFGIRSATETAPASGKGSYSGSAGGFANDGKNNFVIKGTSNLTVDFFSQTYSTNLSFSGQNLLSGGPSLPTHTYSGSDFEFGYPLNSSLTFGGALNGANGTSGTGGFNGSFFGPNQEEYGYVFHISGGDITAVGAATGTRQSFIPAVLAPAPIASTFPAAVLNAIQSGTVAGGDFAALDENPSGPLVALTGISAPISYDSKTGLYTIILNSPGGSAKISDASGISGSILGMASYRTLDADPDSRTGDVDGNVIGSYDTVILPNSADPHAFSLSYTGFNLTISPYYHGVDHSYLVSVFGVPATGIPTSGTASYSGIVSGFARQPNDLYIISGTSSLVANFSTNTYSTNLSFTGQSLDGTKSLSSQSFAGTSSGSSVNGSPLNGNLSGSGTGNWAGRFFGPGAAEYGYVFSVAGSGYSAVGVAVGKK